MPKQTFTLNDFSGGANGYVDPLDIADNELAQCQGFKAEPGTVIVLGDMKGSYTLGTGDTAAYGNIDVESGYGLFTFSHDYNMAGGDTDAGNNVALADTDYFVMMSRLAADKHNRIDVYDTALHTWRPDMIELGGSVSDNRLASLKPCFFVVDGALRVSPGNFSQVASGATLYAGDATGDFAAEINPGGHELVVTDVGLEADVAVGDTIIVGKSSADTPGQEMIALIVNDDSDDEALTAARNMTGAFNSSVDASTSGLDVIYVMPDTRWRGVVKRKNFVQAGTAGTFTEWYSTYAHPRPPVSFENTLSATTGTSYLDFGAISTQYTMPFLANLTSGAVTVSGSIPPSIHFGHKLDEANDDATWDGAYIHIYCTALYDEAKQESQPNRLTVAGSPLQIAAAKELGIYVAVNHADADVASGAYQINKRVTGARLYYEDETNDPGILYQLLEIDFEKGVKKAEAETFTTWTEVIADEVVECPHDGSNDHGSTASERTTEHGNAFIFPDPPKAFSYEINNGYPSDVNTHARYKTAVVSNRRLFAANVYQSGKADGDRMLSSPVNKFDTLPEYGNHIIDVTKGDGDQIVKLEAYADRILQFKKRTLYIINVGGGLGEEFLESQHKNMGVENPSQTCMTEYGVAWVNSHGVFLYDGQEITDLTLNKLQMTNTTTRPRALNIIEANIPTIGYHPDNKWLIINVASDVSTAFEAEAWIHDFKNGSWAYSQEFSADADYKSNMIWTPDNNLVFAAGTNSSNTPDFIKYRAPSANMSQDKLLLLTKEFHLDAPGIKKKLRSIYVTYSASANSYIEADLIYKSISGEATDDLEEADSGSTYYTEALGFKSTSGAVRTVELVPTTYSTNAYTFQLKLHNDDAAYPYGADFKLYNISFVYRPLGAR